MYQNMGDTTYTKIFVGGLAWETKTQAMRRYFEEFGEIIEAIVITDKNTGRSKGYGFVTFKDPDAAMRACENASPMIDGRRANCNLASLGSHGRDNGRPSSGSMLPSNYPNNTPRMPVPYPVYGRYSGYPQSTRMMNYYNVYSGQQMSSIYAGPGAGSSGSYYNYYPYYGQYGQYSNPLQYSYLAHQQSHGVGAFNPNPNHDPDSPSEIASTGCHAQSQIDVEKFTGKVSNFGS